MSRQWRLVPKDWAHQLAAVSQQLAVSHRERDFAGEDERKPVRWYTVMGAQPAAAKASWCEPIAHATPHPARTPQIGDTTCTAAGTQIFSAGSRWRGR